MIVWKLCGTTVYRQLAPVTSEEFQLDLLGWIVVLHMSS